MRLNVYGIIKGKSKNTIINVFELGKKFVRFTCFSKDKEYIEQRLHETLTVSIETSEGIITGYIEPIKCKSNLQYKSFLRLKNKEEEEKLIRYLAKVV